METWILLLISLSVSVLLRPFFNLLFPSTNPKPPPGPFSFPILSRLLLLRKPFSELEPVIRSLHAKLGPIVSLRFGPRLAIFIADRSLAHQAFVQNGAVFANRPPPLAIGRVLSSNQHNINSASYGPTWRLLRRNLTSEILHPSRVKSYAHARKWVLQILQDRIELQSKSGDPIRVLDNFQFAMFCLLVLMCFGDKLDEKQIEDIQRVERAMILNAGKFNILNFWPKLTKFVFRKRWEQFLKLRKEQEDVLIPLIRARKEVKEQKLNKDDCVLSYVDTLFDLKLPDEMRELKEEEIVTLCNEFLNAGTDTTSTALQWIMANLVKHPQIQEKLFMEIKGVMGDGQEEEVLEDDLQKMKYLQAIVLEGLRRHPPAHFLLPHAVTEDVMLDKYLIPKNSSINFMVADMGWDPNVWEDPIAFKPERFISKEGEREAFDITGSREIKMMPFGVGRRICPGYGLAMLHLEYFVANLIWKFEWKAADGDEIDLSEKQEFTMVMKNPLQALVSPRFKPKA